MAMTMISETAIAMTIIVVTSIVISGSKYISEKGCSFGPFRPGS